MGTRRIDENLLALEKGDPNRKVNLKKNLADQYWLRESDPRYLDACKEFERESAAFKAEEKHPKDVSLYEFASEYRADWRKSHDIKVPHITPNFSRIPNRLGNKSRYLMYLRSLILVHVPGAKLDDIELLDLPDLEMECRLFCEKSDCPKLVKEEFQESQREDERQKKGGPSGRGDEHDDDDEPLENPRGSQEDLFIEPEAIPEQYEQAEPYERLYGLIDIQAGEILDEDNQYDDAEFLKKAKLVNWHEDAKKLGLTSGAELKTLDKWLDEQVQTANLHRDLAATGGLPSDLNEKQFQAFAIVRNFLIEVRRKGVGNVPQLLLQISGPAGSGKTFFLNTLRRWAQEILNCGSEFILSAAPTGAAAYLIGGTTLHSLLNLPILT